MDITALVKRLKYAHACRSLRELAKDCEVSHEYIRKLILSPKEPNVTSNSYAKLDAGLKKNGF